MALPLIVVFSLLILPFHTSATGPVKLGVFVWENLEGIHTQSSKFGTSLGSLLMPILDNTHVENSVPLRSNETVRILEEMTEDRKVAVTTLYATASNGVIDYPAVVFADDDIKFTDLTWKVDDGKAMEMAKALDLGYCLVGTCTGLATPPNRDSAAGRRNLTAVTASISIYLYKLSTGKAEWMKTYRQVVSHTDPRLAFEQAAEMAADQVAEDLKDFFGIKGAAGTKEKGAVE
jgi:hypothetical protein